MASKLNPWGATESKKTMSTRRPVPTLRFESETVYGILEKANIYEIFEKYKFHNNSVTIYVETVLCALKIN